MNLGEAADSGPYPERDAEPDCSYYMRTGLCRFGMTCKFNHPPDRKLVTSIHSSNLLSGISLRPLKALHVFVPVFVTYFFHICFLIFEVLKWVLILKLKLLSCPPAFMILESPKGKI